MTKRWTVLQGDLLHGRDAIDVGDVPFDAMLCDPPYELGFMSKKWDRSGVAFDPATWTWVLEHLRPGAHVLAFGGTRTHHRMMCAIEDAGFEIRDCLSWMYGSGFPKSLNISKAIDAAAGAEREVIGVNEDYLKRKPNGMQTPGATAYNYSAAQQVTDARITAPSTDSAKTWEGYGTALKPAWEPIVLARKSVEGTVAENVQAHGVGGIAIDACRIQGEPVAINRLEKWSGFGQLKKPAYVENMSTSGRWPANVVLSHTERCVSRGVARVKGDARQGSGARPGGFGDVGAASGSSHPNARGHADADGYETIETWDCAEECPVKMLDVQTGVLTSGQLLSHHKRNGGSGNVGTFEIRDRTGEPCNFGGDSGGASRFFKVCGFSKDDALCDVLNVESLSRDATERTALGRALATQPLVCADSAEDSLVRAFIVGGTGNVMAEVRSARVSARTRLGENVVANARDVDEDARNSSIVSAPDHVRRCPSYARNNLARSTRATENSFARVHDDDTARNAHNVSRVQPLDASIRCNSLASDVVPLKQIGTMMTTASPQTSDGSVESIMLPITAPSVDPGATAYTRFLYTSKVSTSERNDGLDDLPEVPSYMVANGSKSSGLDGERYERTTTSHNPHPTMKPVALTEYLAKLLLPPRGIGRPRRILVPFAGVGSEMLGALRAGWDEVVGIELSDEYVRIARLRLSRVDTSHQVSLFEGLQ